MKKIIYLANLRLPTEKAYGIQITKMCEAFAFSGLEVSLVFPYRRNKIRKSIFEYYGVKNNFVAKMLSAPDFYLPGQGDVLAAAIKNFISALILGTHALFQKDTIIYSREELLVFIMSYFRRDVFFEAHKFSKYRTFYYGRFKNAGLKIVTISNGLKEEFVRFGFDSKNIIVAPDGVDLTDFDINISKEESREKIGLPQNKTIIMYTGHLFEWKGTNLLAEIAQNFPEDLFVFVGGTDYDLNIFKKKFGHLHNVIVYGHKPHEEIPVFLKAADVLILPNSAKEKISFFTSPLKLFEYMASKRPIIASNLPSLREILNENNAILVMPDDSLALVEGVKKVLSNPTLSNRLSQSAFADVQQYTWDKRVKNIMDFFK